MVRRKTCFCDICGNSVSENWKATFYLIWGGDTVYHKPRKENERHACIKCIKETEYLPGLHLADETKWDHVRRWCMSGTNIEGILFFPEVEQGKDTIDISKPDRQRYWEYRPCSDFNEDVEKIARFVEEEIVD